jgi:hypothetical protein
VRAKQEIDVGGGADRRENSCRRSVCVKTSHPEMYQPLSKGQSARMPYGKK